MATIRKRGGKRQVQIRRKGQTLSRTFIQKADAQRWANQTEMEVDRKGLQPDLTALEHLTVSDLLQRFHETIAPKRRHKETETIVINAFLRHRLARIRLSELAPGHFAAYRDERLSAGTKTCECCSGTPICGLRTWLGS